ncbi:hypothetical protein DZA50_01085 [Kangiella sp. HD9-110m-PIT-SAG07]|nr:hypothetical protein DZA50_01085 [Kangiella sp. HD9-110m-PIT-SAG07]
MLNANTANSFSKSYSYKLLITPNIANDKVSRLFISCTLFLLGTLVLFFIINAFDTRLLDGMPVWHKPIRFGLSFSLHFITLTLLSQLIADHYRTKYRFAFFAYVAAISLWVEYGYMAIQASRARRSHFNFETEFESLMYAVMGVGALFLVAVTFVLGIMIWRYADKNPSGLRIGAIMGLVLGSVLTLITAGYMSSNVSYIEHRLTNTPNIAPYLGWSRVSGDYKPAHFIATHMMQLLPLIGWWADSTKWGQRLSQKIGARTIVIIATLLLTILTAVLFTLAINDVPLFPL